MFPVCNPVGEGAAFEPAEDQVIGGPGADAEAVAEAGAGGDDLVAAEDREEEIATPAADGFRAHLHPGGDGGQTPVVHQVTLGRRGQRPEPPGP